jgi:phage baseplate assembly protein W
MAIKQWEPRIKVTGISLSDLTMDGRRQLTVQGEHVATGNTLTINQPIGIVA